MTLEGAIPKLQVKNLRVKNIQFKRRHRKTAAEKPVGGKYFSSEGAIPKLQVKNPEIKYHPKTADENSCVSKVPSQNWRPNTEPLQCHWLPATAFRRLKIQIPITFTMRPSHVPGNKHLQKKQRSQVHQKHINDQCGSAARVSMSKCPILVHEHRVLIAQMNYCIKTDAKK